MKTSNTTGLSRFQRLVGRDSIQPLFGRYRFDLDMLSLTAEGLQTLFAAPADTVVGRRGPGLDAEGIRAPVGPLGEPGHFRFAGVDRNAGGDLFAQVSNRFVTTGDGIGPGK